MLTKDRLDEIVPIGNAAMEDRTFIEWDKDDIDALKLMKVDVLALGMLTCIRKAFDLIACAWRRPATSSRPCRRTTPRSTTCCCKGDAIGVFQVESRAQMNMLPRLKPQGILRSRHRGRDRAARPDPGRHGASLSAPARSNEEAVNFPSPSPEHGDPDELKGVLGRTLGVPLFQEQAMKLAMVAARFSAEEANQLRRAMATFRNVGTIGAIRDEDGRAAWSRAAMSAISRSAASSRSRASAATAFPKATPPPSRSSSMSRPGSNATIPPPSPARCSIRSRWASTRRRRSCATRSEHGVEVRPVDVNASHWDNTLERRDGRQRSRCASASARSTAFARNGARHLVDRARRRLCRGRGSRAPRPPARPRAAPARGCRCDALARPRSPRGALGGPPPARGRSAAALRRGARARRRARYTHCRRCRSRSMSPSITR